MSGCGNQEFLSGGTIQNSTIVGSEIVNGTINGGTIDGAQLSNITFVDESTAEKIVNSILQMDSAKLQQLGTTLANASATNIADALMAMDATKRTAL